MTEQKVRGLAIDLSDLAEGDIETAVRIAAMFLDKGSLASTIETAPDGTLVMKTYEIVDHKVQVKLKGPFTVGSDGTVSDKPSAPDRVEVKDEWPCDVFRGHVVALVGRKTSGCGEVIAAAFKQSWRTNKGRTQVVAKFYTAGKGTGQTYFPVGSNYWLRLSTSFCLQPDGSEIEGSLGPGPNVPIPGNENEWWSARHTLFVRLSVLPRAVFPPQE